MNLDFGRLAKLGFITPSTIDLDLARDFSMVKRRLFRRLCFFGPEEEENGVQSKRRCPIVLVTSGNPGEGKTFSSINFALSLTIEEQLNVLLIDSDLATRVCLGSWVFPIENTACSNASLIHQPMSTT